MASEIIGAHRSTSSTVRDGKPSVWGVVVSRPGIQRFLRVYRWLYSVADIVNIVFGSGSASLYSTVVRVA
jgi:hypothetical protein